MAARVVEIEPLSCNCGFTSEDTLEGVRHIMACNLPPPRGTVILTFTDKHARCQCDGSAWRKFGAHFPAIHYDIEPVAVFRDARGKEFALCEGARGKLRDLGIVFL